MATDLSLISGAAGNRLGTLDSLIKDADRRIAEANTTIETAKEADAKATTQEEKLFLSPALGGFTERDLGGVKYGCTCPHEPEPSESAHPENSLRVDDKGIITTPAGYKIEATKQHEWIITGPDGKSTRIWGDPHVDESDGGKWDFKRDSTFVLPDGTRINAKTTPWKNGKWTVTDSLEIISGNERVKVTGIAEGKGKAGEVTRDGFQHVNSFGGKDVFVMGVDTDDWSLGGKEIVGSENEGEKIKTGLTLQIGEWKPGLDLKPADTLSKIFDSLSKLFGGLRDFLHQEPARPSKRAKPADRGCWAPHRPALDLASLGRTFSSLGLMLQRLADQSALTQSVRSRNSTIHS